MNFQRIKTADAALTQDIHHYRNIKDKLYKTNALKIIILLIIHPYFVICVFDVILSEEDLRRS